MSTKAQREKVRAFLAEIGPGPVIDVLTADTVASGSRGSPGYAIVQHFTWHGGHLLAEARAEWARHRQERPCEHCGNAYVASRADTRYCSGRCRVAAHRARVTPKSSGPREVVTP